MGRAVTGATPSLRIGRLSDQSAPRLTRRSDPHNVNFAIFLQLALTRPRENCFNARSAVSEALRTAVCNIENFHRDA
jgi:hypothetical protein